MRYFLDTEFAERPCTIDLLSLALVREDGAELYVINRDFDYSQANDFVRLHVVPHLGHPDATSPEVPGDGDFTVPFLSRFEIRSRVIAFVDRDAKPEIWGYYSDYDWVVFCWLFGQMVDLPNGWPFYCRDLRQALDAWGMSDVRQPESPIHNALLDARWIAKTHPQFFGR